MARGFGRGSLRLAGDGVWVGRWRDSAGAEHRVRLSDDRGVAEAKLRDQVFARDCEAVSLSSLADAYLADAKIRLKPKSFRSVQDGLLRVVSALQELSPAAVTAYRAKRINTPVLYACWKERAPEDVPTKFPSNRTVNMEVKALSTMLNWAVANEMIGRNPIAKLKPLPMRECDLRKRRRPLDDAEIAGLLAAIAAMDLSRAVAQEPMWRLMLDVGLRWGEVTALRPEHLRDDTLYLPCDETKSGKSRAVPIPAELAARLRLPFRMPNGKPWLRERSKNAQVQLEAAMKHAGIAFVGEAPERAPDSQSRSVDIHAMRKTSATRLAVRGVPMAILKHLLGHTDSRVTERYYVHVETQRVRAAVEAGMRVEPARQQPVAAQKGAQDQGH